MSLLEAYLRRLWEVNVSEAGGRPYADRRGSELLVSLPGTQLWKPRNDHVGNRVTQDLLRLCDEWGLKAAIKQEAGGLYHAEGTTIFVSLEDGYLSVDVSLYEDDRNRVHASQETRILGQEARDRLVEGLLSPLPNSD